MIPFEKLVKALNIYNGIETPEQPIEESAEIIQEEQIAEVETETDFFEGDNFSQKPAPSDNASKDDAAAILENEAGDLEDSDFSSQAADNEIKLEDDFQEVSNESDSFSGGFDILEEEPVKQKAHVQDNQDDKIDILGHTDFPATEQSAEVEAQLPDNSSGAKNEEENILTDSFGQDEAAFDILEEQPPPPPEEQGVPSSPEQQQGSQPVSGPVDSGEFPPPPPEEQGVPSSPEQQQGSQPVSGSVDSGEFPPPPEDQQ
ncbi:MAG: hypothetical protein ACQES9_09840 [Myxococcota bacterium]